MLYVISKLIFKKKNAIPSTKVTYKKKTLYTISKLNFEKPNAIQCIEATYKVTVASFGGETNIQVGRTTQKQRSQDDRMTY